MRKNQKLKAVVRHEFLTTVKQKSFWISMIAVPLFTGIVVLIGVLTDTPDPPDIDPANNTLNIAVIDNSTLVKSEVVDGYKLERAGADRREALEESVKRGEMDGLIVYPQDLADTGRYEVFADNTDQDNAAVIDQLGRTILQQSLLAPLGSDKLMTLALSGGQASVQSYKDGKPARTLSEYIVPGAFLVLFYIILIFSVGYALTSVSEEKENRSIEMVLSYVNPQTLILGKLLAIILVSLTQITFIAAMAGVSYLVARSMGNDLSLPFSVSDLSFVPAEIGIGAGFLIVGFVFYVGLMAMIGAIFPSSKEASGFSTVFYILPAVPFWGMDAILNQPTGLFAQILTYLPLTSTTTVLTRNAAGNLSLAEGLISLLVLTVATLIVIGLAARAFRLGTLEYSDRIKLGSLFRK